jgi:hypothetical protein
MEGKFGGDNSGQSERMHVDGSKIIEGKDWQHDSGKPDWSIDANCRRIGANSGVTKNCP